ncbi:MAG: hypothetical protein KKG09_07465 [Verrucomicrobia bacterium]|nr:hypothetical protein [Verrucomicrobiota bacterium]MBU4290884.1 hypothetical protein [Verrucomicrobiota bacterium]MBU4429683.1 hypothetical protein [Verrucomicrobiota bacterium]MBU4497824.1 hypothetical protein [Verrucomicrobiota bacterium]MCG2680633.1 hypothetical protein [Kiritimatiellia bacterium]
MTDSKENREELGENDIVFDCPHCDKSLAIDYRGAGLAIHCPDCGEEIEVPIPEGVDITDIDRLGVVEVKDAGDSISSAETMAIPESPDQIRMLMTELDELRFRRRFLEQQRNKAVKGLQAMERQVTALRTALDQIEDILKQLREPSADDTQNLT